jgi:hypothetical protein
VTERRNGRTKGRKKERKEGKAEMPRPLKADSHIACRAHAVPLPCREAKGLECVFPI